MGTANKFTMASSGGVWFLSKNYVRLKKSKKLKSKFLKSDDFKYVFISKHHITLRQWFTVTT